MVENERRIRESEARLGYIIGFYERAQKPRGSGSIMRSRVPDRHRQPAGILAFLNADESDLYVCLVKDRNGRVRYVGEAHSLQNREDRLWGEAVRQRRPVITNDYEAPNPKKKGNPDQHRISPGI